MSDFLWLSDLSDTLVLDSRVISCTLGGSVRKLSKSNYSGASGIKIKGTGNYSAKTFIFSVKEKTEGADFNFWNSRRNDFIKWTTRPITDTIYLYMNNGEDDTELRIKIQFEEIPDDKFTFLKTSETKSYKAISESAFWEKSTTTSDTEAITGSSEQSMTFTVGGTIPASPIFSFTPTADQTSFRVRTYDNYLFQLSGTFYAGVSINYHMKTGRLYLGTSEVKASSYLSKGSNFNLPIGSNTIYIKCSGAGTFGYEYNERYL